MMANAQPRGSADGWTSSPVGGGALDRDDFRPVGQRGVTDPRNGYAQAMAYFKDRLFVGMTRDPLCLMKRPSRRIPPPVVDFWPVNCPDPEEPEKMRAEILSYDPDRDAWELAFKAPMAFVAPEYQTTGRAYVQRDVGYRSMAVIRGRSDHEPCLYVGSISASGSRILRCADGRSFDTTPARLSGPSIRSLVACNGKLYAAFVGEVGGHGNESAHREMWETDDPASGEWRAVSPPGFGDPANVSLFEMCEFGGFLYVSTMNPTGGFQLWKSDLQGRPPYRWQKVLGAGAYRGYLNEFGISMAVFDDFLYVGTGIAGGGYDRNHHIGPAAAELIRLRADDTWELVVGAARATPDGFKAPLSGQGPGFNCFLNGYVWRQCVHDGWLYISTFNAGCFVKYRPHALRIDRQSDMVAFYTRLLPHGDLDAFIEEYSGCHVWRTRDGEQFHPVTRDGFGTPWNYGVRQMVSTPHGIFMGTANPFGPEVGVRREGQWRYEPNPRGGSEVWLGSAGGSRRRPPAHRPDRRAENRAARYRRSIFRLGREVDQFVSASLFDEDYGRSGFHHVGYWDDATTGLLEANERLVAELAERATGRGRVLDAVCGRGGTTEALARRFGRDRVTGIDSSYWAVDWARANFPGLDVRGAEPTRLHEEDGAFAAVFCFEGALKIETRYLFLKEAFRVLEPGGHLLMADLLVSVDAVRAHPRLYRPNYVKDVAAYRRLFTRAGFAPDVEILDRTEQCLWRFADHLSATLRERRRRRELAAGRFTAAMAALSHKLLTARSYLLVCANKPA